MNNNYLFNGYIIFLLLYVIFYNKKTEIDKGVVLERFHSVYRNQPHKGFVGFNS